MSNGEGGGLDTSPERRLSGEGLWTYGDPKTIGADVASGMDLAGFSVKAVDGGIGKVDEATYEPARSYVVVDTGPFIFGKKVMLPAGVVMRVDVASETLFVELTKDEIKNAPQFDEATYVDEAYRDELGGYFQGGAGRGL